MDAIAYMLGEKFIYWSSIILTLSAATAILFFWAFYLGKSGNAFGAALGMPISLVFSIVAGRFAHWYCRADSYADFHTAMTDYTSGGYALMGVFAACILVALILRAVRIIQDLPAYTDSLCLAGSAGIAVGRLACFYTAADRGQIVSGTTGLPWVYPVTNAVSGVVENRLATFVIQSMVTAAIFVFLTIVYFCQTGRRKHTNGVITLLFMLLYGASQVVLDSTRYDSLYMRSNGFISIVQILGAVGLVTAGVAFSVQLLKASRFRWWNIPMWIVMLGLLGGAGYMEYHVQRHGDQAVFAYSVMSACLGAYCLITMALASGASYARRKPNPEEVDVSL